jgi:hypothetical protein
MKRIEARPQLVSKVRHFSALCRTVQGAVSILSQRRASRSVEEMSALPSKADTA